MSKFYDCYSKIWVDCNLGNSLNIDKILHSTFDYICGPGREKYLGFSPCMYRISIRNSIKQCTKSQSEIGANIHSKDDVCSLQRNYTKCLKNSASKCGEDAVEYIKTYSAKFREGVLDCPRLSKASWNGRHGAITVTVAGIFVAIGLVV